MISNIINRFQARGGFKKQPLDKRDYKYSGTTNYQDIDLRLQGWIIKNQWFSNACTGYALEGLIEYILRTTYDYNTEISPILNWYQARLYEGTTSTNSGVYLRDVLKSVYDVGVTTYKTCPLPKFPYTKKPSNYAYSVAGIMKYFFDHTKYYLLTPEDVMASLKEGSPVVCGLMLNNSWFGNKNGFVDSRETNGSSHAMLVIGFDTEKDCFILRNSWGFRWGDRGYAYVPKQYFLDNAHDCWTIKVVD